ncbi:hypothetical protein AALJ34_16975 [Paraclostridium bifermentans]|uniref:hypothetical protein n=1 Tax=Paraclostridium bifermentans TaxID=1490 RepID=UPI001C1171E9|nr:hypothetical protein [Paraclostridium bifermentans]MBU5290006.1 hypothetical protein [Paraclostridium bifermentans]
MQDIVKTELTEIRNTLISIKDWEKELKLIENKVNAFTDINYENLGFKSGGKTFTLDDLLEKDEARINVLKSNIFYAKYKLNDLEIYLSPLDEDERMIIKEKYIENLKLKSPSFEFIAQRTQFSKTSVKRIYDRAIAKLAKIASERINIA